MLDTGSSKGNTKRNDIIAIVVILAIALAVVLIAQLQRVPVSQAAADEVGPYAVVQNTEGERDVLPLSQDTTLTIVCSKGTNTVTVVDGAVSITEADCENQICVNTGAMKDVGDMIVCLPHQLVVQIVEEPDDAEPLGF